MCVVVRIVFTQKIIVIVGGPLSAQKPNLQSCYCRFMNGIHVKDRLLWFDFEADSAKWLYFQH